MTAPAFSAALILLTALLPVQSAQCAGISATVVEAAPAAVPAGPVPPIPVVNRNSPATVAPATYATPNASPAQPTMAVLDFSADNASASDATRVSDLIRTAVVRTGKYSVVEKNNMNKVLAEQIFQKTGCTDEICATRLGRVLNARKVIVGSCGMLEGNGLINAHLVDVETGKIDSSELFTMDKVGNIGRVVDDIVAKLTGANAALPAGVAASEAPPAVAPPSATIAVSPPLGATVAASEAGRPLALPTAAVAPPASATVAIVELPFELRTKQLKVQVTPEVQLVLPDGDSRITVEHAADGRALTIGTRYNYFAGKIRYWLSYQVPLVDPFLLTTSVSDDIGFGRIYYDERYLERARNGRIGTGLILPFVTVVTSVGRTGWHLSPYGNPALTRSGLIDSVEVVVTTVTLPEVFEPVDPDENIIRYRHAFRWAGGNYRYDRIEVQLVRTDQRFLGNDEIKFRVFTGLAFAFSPTLPDNETFALGGAAGVKGYRYEEFRGPGMDMGAAEYGWIIPGKLNFSWIGLRVGRILAVGFAEGGRIAADWFRPDTSWKYSGGLGIRLEGKFLQHYAGRIRLYVAQAEGISSRGPVYYALMDLR